MKYEELKKKVEKASLEGRQDTGVHYCGESTMRFLALQDQLDALLRVVAPYLDDNKGGEG